MTCYTIPDINIRETSISVPLDWNNPQGETITVYAREAVDPKKKHEDLPLLLFLQGGPGGKSPRPLGGAPSWFSQALKSHRVVLLDQRGTGRSTPIEGRTMKRFVTDEEGAEFLSCFRADSIIKDCEHLRKTVYKGCKWSTLGQSYGGFLTLTYLSFAPEALEACYITGGLAGLTATADDVYACTYPRVAYKTMEFYKRYPQNVARVEKIADILASEDIRLPDGDRLTVRRFQSVGGEFGMGPGYEVVHWLIDEALLEDLTPGDVRLSDTFLNEIGTKTSFASNPLFAVLQESIYAQNCKVSNWAAERERAAHPAFAPEARPMMFTGEMIYPWMFEEIRALRPFRAAVDVLAQKVFEEPLYDPVRLKNNEVPVAAAVYYDDMFVDSGLSLETAKTVGNLRAWVTNEHEHDGLRQTPKVLERLMEMVARSIQ